jgi:hypothetical protein
VTALFFVLKHGFCAMPARGNAARHLGNESYDESADHVGYSEFDRDARFAGAKAGKQSAASSRGSRPKADVAARPERNRPRNLEAPASRHDL